MPGGCLRDRPGSAEEPWRAERPSGRRGPAGHRQSGLAVEPRECPPPSDGGRGVGGAGRGAPEL